jgi:hypothetical protein
LEQAGKPYLAFRSTGPNNTPIYTLASRKPADVWRLPIMSSMSDWIAAPVIN